jgi:hypothetical protein
MNGRKNHGHVDAGNAKAFPGLPARRHPGGRGSAMHRPAIAGEVLTRRRLELAGGEGRAQLLERLVDLAAIAGELDAE